MLRRVDNRCSVRLANIGSGERRRHDLLAISLNNKAHAVVDHHNLDVPSTLFESGAVPGYLGEKTASLPALSGPRQDDVVSGIFLSTNGIEALAFGQGSPTS
jgi:glutathione S-transferase